MHERFMTATATIATAIALTMLAGCGSGMEMEDEAKAENARETETESVQDRRAGEDEDADTTRRAVATLEAKGGSSISGEAFFVETAGGETSFGVHVEGLSPGRYAVHIHELGDCSSEDASSAGDHWNPERDPHGKRGSDAFHFGDLGNIEVGPDGDGSLSGTSARWTFGDGSAPVAPGNSSDLLGRAIVVHQNADDFTTQPDGDAGDRIACGVIAEKQPAS